MQNNRIVDVEILQAFIRLCENGWQQGWHERNGGNCTYRLRPEQVDACRPYLKPTPGTWQSLGITVSNLAGEYFVATGSGKYFANVLLAPQDNLCIVQLNDAGDAWRIVWGLEKGGVPTSEFPTHMLNHSIRKQATNGENRVIYHAHPANIIAMTYVLPLQNRDFSRALWQSATECPVVFPQGVGVVEWMVPGGTAIAHASGKLMAQFDAIVWAHHGLFCAGPDFDTSFGLMHTIEKAAEIFVKVQSMGGACQTITDVGLRAIAHDFGVSINEEFLD